MQGLTIMEQKLQPSTPPRKRAMETMEKECSTVKKKYTELEIFKKARGMSWSEVMAVADPVLRRRLQVRKDRTEAFLFWEDPIK